jgi:hypothetical protein
MQLCEELGGMTLGELDQRMGAAELALWKAKTQVDSFVHRRMEAQKLTYEQALDHARADHRSVMERKAKRHG